MSIDSNIIFPRPVAGDCAEYYFRYIDQVPDVDILTLLHTQRDWFGEWIESLTEEQLHHKYEPGKWTLAQMIGHVMDTERVFAYRMMVISRNEKKPLPGFEQDEFVRDANHDTLNAHELAEEWKAIRLSTIYLARHMNAEMAARIGTANQVPVKASAFVYMMAGHVQHHFKVAQEKYLAPLLS